DAAPVRDSVMIMNARVPWLTGTVTGDVTRERAAAINQLLTGLVTLVTAFVISVTGHVDDSSLIMSGLGLMFVVTGATIVVPWNRLPSIAVAVVPLLDVVAIVLLEVSSPYEGFGLLWVFPSLWLSAAF